MSSAEGTPDRYSRQTRVPVVGRDGQERLAKATVVICGIGALGSVSANLLVRAGVGRVRLIDRDFVELHNLQRQVLFDEEDARQNLPKAIAAASKLSAVNSTVVVEPVVRDLDHRTIDSHCRGATVIVDGTDNFETRFLINDYSLARNIPWIYGGCIGTGGQAMSIVPGQTSCFRCLMDGPPPAGTTPTCETAGILGPVSSMVASFQAAEAMKVAMGQPERVHSGLWVFDAWDNRWRGLNLGRLREAACPVCREKRYDWLNGSRGSHTVRLCGRNAVQVLPEPGRPFEREQWHQRLADNPAAGDVETNAYLTRFRAEGFEVRVFGDGRAIIGGTDDVGVARAIYARHVSG